MDESLQALEDRLEQLVPKGLSDDGRERMETRIDELAAGVDEKASPRGRAWKFGAAAAAVAAVIAVESTMVSPPSAHVEATSAPAVAAAPGPELQDEDDLMELLTLSLSRSVQARTDRGLVVEPGTETPLRYWSYEVTSEEELMDKESGYAVRVVSRREEWVPVAVTQL